MIFPDHIQPLLPRFEWFCSFLLRISSLYNLLQVALWDDDCGLELLFDLSLPEASMACMIGAQAIQDFPIGALRFLRVHGP